MLNYLKKTNTIPIIAGIPCTKKIFLETEYQPYKAATKTQPKKKKAIFLLQIASEINNDQSKPAAKNPLYKP